LRAANRVLVSCGATIAEINAVRRAFSAVKGGGLAACAPHADQVSLIVSDTGAGEEATVASGPTFDPPGDAPDAQSVVERYNLASRLPASILRAINQTANANRGARSSALASRRTIREHYVLLDNRRAMQAAARAARRRGFVVETARDICEQPVAEGCSQMLSRLLALYRRRSTPHEGRAVCLISGGEFSCPVRGRGVGGRNSETALRLAIEMDRRAQAERDDPSRRMNIVALSAGTDGIDGNSPAAGALSDEETLRRSRSRGLDAEHFLEQSDAYSFFNALGDAIVIGPTGTNVRDLRVLLAK
jgi:hydroxypyruvate reductase